jgi:hypothetical protein
LIQRRKPRGAARQTTKMMAVVCGSIDMPLPLTGAARPLGGLTVASVGQRVIAGPLGDSLGSIKPQPSAGF